MQGLALKDFFYPEESNEIQNHLVVRGFLEGIRNIQVILDWRKMLVDAKSTVETVFEKALQVEAIKGSEEGERERIVLDLQPHKTEISIVCMNNLVESLLPSQGSQSDNRGSFREGKKFKRTSSRKKINAEDSGPRQKK